MTDANNEYIHLCQPDSGKSCAACCGIYNYLDHTFPRTDYNFRLRTRLFQELRDKEREWHKIFEAEVAAQEQPSPKLAEAIHNCPFVGYLDPAFKRVGCLLHPAQNDGQDFRDLAFYGAKICAGHECISYQLLSRDEKEALLASLDDWYVYGQCVTDVDMVKDYFRLIAEELGAGIKGEMFRHPDLRQTAREFFSFKRDWRFRSQEPRLGKYYFSYPEYRVARLDYPLLNREEKSPFDSILVSLASEFHSEAELKAAEQLIQNNIQQFISVYQKLTR